jgi:prepilin-type N-terminal cleavage/methylation domain-containing protein
MRRGYTLLEVVVTAVILAVVGAAATSTLAAYKSQKTVASAAVTLDSLARAYGTFHRTVARYPGNLQYLVQYTSGAFPTSCPGTTFTPPLGGWKGPYFHQTFNTATGLDIGVGQVRNAVTRTPTTATRGTVQIFIDNISLQDAFALNDLLDGPGETAVSSTGFFQWTMSSTSVVSAAFVVVGVTNIC